MKEIVNAFKNRADKEGVKAIALTDVVYPEESETQFNTTYVIQKNFNGEWLPTWKDDAFPDLGTRPW